MSQFLSPEQVEMLRDDLTQLRSPNDPLQREKLQIMGDALDNHDEAAFLAAWRDLELGSGARITVEGIDIAPQPSITQPIALPENERIKLENKLDSLLSNKNSGQESDGVSNE